MAIALEFIDFVVPRSRITEKYPGGWEQCLQDHRQIIGCRCWYDDHLLRDGAMSGRDIGRIVDEWESIGFVSTQIVDGEKVWRGMCVIELGGPTLRCDWIGVDSTARSAYLEGTEPGKLVGRMDFDEKPW